MKLQELTEIWNDLDLETFQVGPSWSGCSRAVAMIGDVQISIDTHMPCSFLERTTEVYSCWFEFPKTKALSMAKKYKTATAVESSYPSENYDEYFLQFTDKDDFLLYLIEYHQDDLHKPNSNKKDSLLYKQTA